MVIMASPSRRLGVQAVSQLRRLARHGLGDYGVASRAKASTWRPIGRGGRRTGGKATARAGNRARIPPARARPIPAARKSRVGGKEMR